MPSKVSCKITHFLQSISENKLSNLASAISRIEGQAITIKWDSVDTLMVQRGRGFILPNASIYFIGHKAWCLNIQRTNKFKEIK